MKKIIAFLIFTTFFLMQISSCKKKNETVIQERKESEIFNISQMQEIRKLSRFIATFESYVKKLKVVQSPDLKDIFITISFPFPFKIYESYITKGKFVKKGEKLFLLSSNEMVEAYRNYLKTKDEVLKEKLLSIGLDLKMEPSSEILIVAPDEGVIVYTANEKKEDNIKMQNLVAIIQKRGELIFNLLIPKESFAEETSFYALLGEKTLPMNIMSADEIDNNVKVTLSLKGFDPNDNLQNVEIQIVNIIQNITKVPKSAVLQMGNEYYCFVETADDILEKRLIEGFIDGDVFIITNGVRQTEKIVDNAQKIKILLKLR